MKKLKRNFLFVIVLFLFVSVKSDTEENLSDHDEESISKGSDNNSELTAKEQGTTLDEIECPCVSINDKNGNSKLEKTDHEPSNSDDNIQISRLEDVKESQQVSESKQTNQNANECNQQSGSLAAANSEEINTKDSNKPLVAVEDSKQQKAKEDDKNQKVNDLNDVNSQEEENDAAKSKKRETSGDSPSFPLGLPRDASYFFDDLEPFINNNSDIGRIGRAVPSRDKNQKSKLNGKVKEIIEDDVDEDEEEEKNEEDEKQDEDDYDDEEDIESDCKPTTGCPTTPKCPTTPPCSSTTTPCPPSTTKCTTKHQCPTTCKTTPQCTTSKCPRPCAKGALLVKDMEKESDTSLDSNKKKHRHGKRRFHNKD